MLRELGFPLSKAHLHLTGIQSKILIAIHELGESRVNNESILKYTGISRSNWAVEQNRLIELGLIEKKSALCMSQDNVFRTVNYGLTERGKVITHNLLDISRILRSVAELKESSKFLHEATPGFLDQVRECIEVAIEGYGVNFLGDVQDTLVANYHVVWGEIPRRPETLMHVLKNFFGADGAKTVEDMISSNIRARFHLGEKACADMKSSIENAYLKHGMRKLDSHFSNSFTSSSKNSSSVASLKYDESNSDS